MVVVFHYSTVPKLLHSVGNGMGVMGVMFGGEW